MRASSICDDFTNELKSVSTIQSDNLFDKYYTFHELENVFHLKWYFDVYKFHEGWTINFFFLQLSQLLYSCCFMYVNVYSVGCFFFNVTRQCNRLCNRIFILLSFTLSFSLSSAVTPTTCPYTFTIYVMITIWFGDFWIAVLPSSIALKKTPRLSTIFGLFAWCILCRTHINKNSLVFFSKVYLLYQLYEATVLFGL